MNDVAAQPGHGSRAGYCTPGGMTSMRQPTCKRQREGSRSSGGQCHWRQGVSRSGAQQGGSFGGGSHCSGGEAAGFLGRPAPPASSPWAIPMSPGHVLVSQQQQRQ